MPSPPMARKSQLWLGAPDALWASAPAVPHFQLCVLACMVGCSWTGLLAAISEAGPGVATAVGKAQWLLSVALFAEGSRRGRDAALAPLPLAVNRAERYVKVPLYAACLPLLVAAWRLFTAPLRQLCPGLSPLLALGDAALQSPLWRLAYALHAASCCIIALWLIQECWQVDVVAPHPLPREDCSAVDKEKDADLPTYAARSAVSGAGVGLFAARPFQAGERIFHVTGPFLTLEELAKHPQSEKIREYAIRHRGGRGPVGAVSPMGVDGLEVEQHWGLMNEPPVLPLADWPFAKDHLAKWLPDLSGRFLLPHVTSVHVYPNVALVGSPLADARQGVEEGPYGLSFRALRPIARDEELLWCYGTTYRRCYEPSMAAAAKGGWERRWHSHRRGCLPVMRKL